MGVRDKNNIYKTMMICVLLMLITAGCAQESSITKTRETTKQAAEQERDDEISDSTLTSISADLLNTQTEYTNRD